MTKPFYPSSKPVSQLIPGVSRPRIIGAQGARDMAIAPSKLGRLVAQEWGSEDTVVRRLREAGLVVRSVSDDLLKAALRRAVEEDSGLPPGEREFNSPNERARVFLEPFLTRKGRRWAVPLRSLEPWWRFWG